MAEQVKTHDRWMVYGEGQRAPTYQHTDERSAVDEAQRLARNHPGLTFFVLKAVRGYKLALPPLVEIIPDPNEPPF